MQETLFIRDLAFVLLVAAASGWLLQRLGLSTVVGYLIAGIAIGPYSPGLTLVSDEQNIQLLAQIGLVFLMFAIGLGLSLARLQRLGSSILAAVAISALLLFNLCRLFGAALNWDGFQTLFLAGTLMISSSAIIIKILDELNLTHQRAGQLALGITVLEDVVAVVMLTLFLSLMKVEAGQSTPLWQTLGLLGAFVALLVVASVLVIPRVLNLFSRDNSSELRLTTVAGLVLLAAVWALQAGYSMALGAFILGVVLAGTRHRDEIEKAFEGVQSIFGAVFFVAVGMMFNFRVIAEVWWLVLAVTSLTLVARPLCCSFALITVGHSSRNAVQAGLALIPIGEFAFVMIQVSRSTDVLPESFYALAIGVSLATAVIGPLLTRRSERICEWIEARQPRVLQDTISLHHRWLAELQDRTQASLLWRLSSKRLGHLVFYLLLATALLLASRPLYDLGLRHLGRDLLFPYSLPLLAWTLTGAVLVGPLIAIWRNFEALSMILAEGATQRLARGEVFRPLILATLKTVGAVTLLAWLLLMVPFGPWVFWLLCLTAVGLLFYAPVWWRRLMVVHSRLEIDFRERMKAASMPGATSGLAVSVLERPQQWNLQIDEIILPFQSSLAGRRLADLELRPKLGCSVVAIDRQGCVLTNPGGEERLFAGDKLLVLGTPEQLAAAEPVLRATTLDRQAHDLEDSAMETLDLPEDGPLLGRTLRDLRLTERFGIQICGIQRGSDRILVPRSTEFLHPKDRLLLLGSHGRIRDFRTAVWGQES